MYTSHVLNQLQNNIPIFLNRKEKGKLQVQLIILCATGKCQFCSDRYISYLFLWLISAGGGQSVLRKCFLLLLFEGKHIYQEEFGEATEHNWTSMQYHPSEEDFFLNLYSLCVVQLADVPQFNSVQFNFIYPQHFYEVQKLSTFLLIVWFFILQYLPAVQNEEPDCGCSLLILTLIVI